jgi:U32 family peptidase
MALRRRWFFVYLPFHNSRPIPVAVSRKVRHALGATLIIDDVALFPKENQVPQKLALPLIAETAPASWEGLTPLDAPEPFAPQGAYNQAAPEAPLSVPLVAAEKGARRVELLAPAGGLDAAFAAFHFGADAIYLGLKKFSARAEAENFTLEELDEVTAYAHALEPNRRVFVTINTLIRQDELPELIDALAVLEEIGVDAVILQDLGVYRTIRQFFPGLELHGSTQMAVHNRAGAETLTRLGFQRVVLARELTFEEVNDITSTAGVETEIFIHGALCYSYSGLCLFSSQTLGRSGNRGKCAYSCRDSYEVADAPMTLRDGSPVKRDPRTGFPFSMKDLALPDHLPALRAAGVSCFKIEGRKKSPLYVATTTDYYRKLIDGTLKADERPLVEADLQTVFSRPWTRLFVQSHKDKEVADRDTVGHRGAWIGQVEAIVGKRADARLRFRAARPLQRHDGLQIDLPILGKPFGFAVDRLWLAGTRRDVVETPAGALVEVGLPHDHPEIPVGAPIYCSSSQAVKQKYRHERPKPGLWHGRKPLSVDAILTHDRLVVVARTDSVEVRRELAGPFAAAHDLAAMENAMRGCFGRLGQSRFRLETLAWINEAGGFVPVSQLNQLRRDLIADVEAALHQVHRRQIAAIQRTVSEPEAQARGEAKTLACASGSKFRWSIKVDRVAFLDAFDDDDWHDLDEVIVDIARDHPTIVHEKLTLLGERLGREKIRLALPPLTRAWEEKGIQHKIRQFQDDGWRKWEAANLSAWHYLGIDPQHPNAEIDLSTDWPIYVINRLAAEQVLAMGATRFVLSPEDGLANARSLWTEFGAKAVLIVHQDTPQFLAESCAYANLIGGCPGKANCRFESMEMVSSHGERVTAIDYHCRTIVLNQQPFCLSDRLGELAQAGALSLRADFLYRAYDAETVRDLWRRIRAGRAIPGGQSANFERGIL